MKKSKLIIFIAALLCLVFILSACGTNPEQSGGPDVGDSDNDTYCTVTFDSQGGSDVQSQRVLKGNRARVPNSPTKEGYIFIGWYNSPDEDAALWLFSTDVVNGDITLYAFWDEEAKISDPTTTLTFELNAARTGYVVTGDSGQSGVIVIPAEYNELPVVEIGDSAFAYSKHNSDINSVTIPDTVTAIGKNAFYSRQSDLTTVHIGANSLLATIGNNAFSGCRALTAINLPTGVISIGDSAFNNCGALNRITVAADNTVYSSEGNNLIEIASHMLIRGSNSSVIPSTVTTIAAAAFRRATLTSLTVPVSVTSIGNYVIQDSAVEEIVYGGTEAQWEQIEKAKLWNMGKTDITIKYNLSQDEEITTMFITINGTKKEISLENNSSVTELVELLKQNDITYTANDYGGFEKVGSLGYTLSSRDTRMTTEPGDVILYSSSSIVLFYGNNTWPYTKIGKIKYNSLDELKSFLGAGQGSVQVTLSLK